MIELVMGDRLLDRCDLDLSNLKEKKSSNNFQKPNDELFTSL